jgi:uncharacterized protein YbjT (DUF2867 family)
MTSKESVTVFGAYGHTGRFVVSELLKREWTPILSGRDPDKLDALENVHPGLDVTDVLGALEREASLFLFKTAFFHIATGDRDSSLYSQAPATLPTTISTKPTMLPMTRSRLGNNPNGNWPRIGSAYPTTQ